MIMCAQSDRMRAHIPIVDLELKSAPVTRAPNADVIRHTLQCLHRNDKSNASEKVDSPRFDKGGTSVWVLIDAYCVRRIAIAMN